MKNKPHKGERITPQVFAPITDPKPYPVNAAKSVLPQYGIYKISFPNGDCVVYGSWRWKAEVTNTLERAASGKHRSRWFQKTYNHFGGDRAKVELIACPLHLDYIHDIEQHLASEHNATLNFKPYEFRVKLWLFIERMKKLKPDEGFVSDQPQIQEEWV